MITGDGSIHGGAQLLYRSIPLAGAVGFVARGAILASDERTLAETAAEGLERLAAASNVTYPIVQTPTERAEVMAPQLLRQGYRAAPEIMAPHHTTTGAQDLNQGEEAILAAMRSSTRHNVRLAQRRGTVVREGAGLTCRYSVRCWPPPHDVPAPRFPRPHSSRPPGPPWPLPGCCGWEWRRSAGEPVSAFLGVSFGDTMKCWRGGWSGVHRDRRPDEALDWAGIRWAAERGLQWYDFQGDADHSLPRLARLNDRAGHHGDRLPMTAAGRLIRRWSNMAL